MNHSASVLKMEEICGGRSNLHPGRSGSYCSNGFLPSYAGLSQ